MKRGIAEVQRISRRAATAELRLREEVSGSLVSWGRLCGYEAARHHRLLCEKLEAVAAGRVRRLMFFLPPGSAKSTWSSVLFPSWYLGGARPGVEGERLILACSHTTGLAAEFGRKARNISQAWGLKLGYEVLGDTAAVDKWGTTNGGFYECAGVGTAIAGKRATLGLIDDPVAGREEAQSELIRNRKWEWYQFDFRNRLKPNAGVVLITTRWHVDDLAGRILAAEGDEWEVIDLPLIAREGDRLGRKVGEQLWPEYFNEHIVRDAKKNPDVFQCLWQNNPVAEEGNFFKADWLDKNTYGSLSELPKNVRVYVGSDHAVRTDEQNDKTCLVAAALDEQDVLWILPDWWWRQGDAGEQVEAMLGMMKRHKPMMWWAGRDHISGALGPFLAKRMREEKCYTLIEESPNRNKSKRALAASIAGRMKMGMVRFPCFADGWSEARSEMLAFDVGKHDDFVDALSLIGAGLDQMYAVPVEVVYKPEVRFQFNLSWANGEDRRSHRVIDN